MSHTPPKSVVQSFGRKDQTIELPAFTTSATSKSAMQSDKLDVAKSAVRGLLLDAEHRYNAALRSTYGRWTATLTKSVPRSVTFL